MKPARSQHGKAALESIEEAVHLLRTCSAATLASYYLGALPFVLGLLFFWADMSRSSFAEEHLAPATLGVAGLFLWAKFWQSIFARRLSAALTGTVPALGARQYGRMLVMQSALQPTGLFVVPLSLIPVLPLGWVFAFYQNLTALGGSDARGIRELMKKAARQSALWPKQNHLILTFLTLFALFVFLNWGTVCFLLPGLLKMLLGIESVFTRNSLSMANTTFFAIMFGLAYLCVDPIVKAVYALRCFYGESLESGEDLKAELRIAGPSVGQLAAVLTLVGFMAAAASAAACNSRGNLPPAYAGGHSPAVCRGGTEPGDAIAPRRIISLPWASAAQTSLRISEFGLLSAFGFRVSDFLLEASTAPAPSTDNAASAASETKSPAGSISPGQLDEAIREVVKQRKYTWRAPREKLAKDEKPKGILARFMDRVVEFLKNAVKSVLNWLDRMIRKLFQSRRTATPGGSGYGWMVLLQLMLYVLVITAAAGLAWLVYRVWQNHRRQAAMAAAEPIRPAPDLTDDNVGAEQLPEDGWTKLAAELLARGELRLALRAFYLASLAHLAERNLITLAKFKSNRDYERELVRRGHSLPELRGWFSDNVTVFDRIWYGLHQVDLQLVNQFAANVDRIKAAGGTV